MQVSVVRGEDWEALYINGILKNENHSIMTERTLEILEEAFNGSLYTLEVEVIQADDKWLSKRGNMPMSLKDVKRAR